MEVCIPLLLHDCSKAPALFCWSWECAMLSCIAPCHCLQPVTVVSVLNSDLQMYYCKLYPLCVEHWRVKRRRYLLPVQAAKAGCKSKLHNVCCYCAVVNGLHPYHVSNIASGCRDLTLGQTRRCAD
jgi:hypothetical protein